MKAGDKIRIIYMDGEPSYEGREGKVTHIDDAGQIHGTWGGCALIPGVDEYEAVDGAAAKFTAGVAGMYILMYVMVSVMEQIFGVAI